MAAERGHCPLNEWLENDKLPSSTLRLSTHGQKFRASCSHSLGVIVQIALEFTEDGQRTLWTRLLQLSPHTRRVGNAESLVWRVWQVRSITSADNGIPMQPALGHVRSKAARLLCEEEGGPKRELTGLLLTR